MLDTGLEIRILRERLKMSAKELAEKVGLSQSQMSRLEKGQRRIDMKVLERIARALTVSPSYFFRGAEAPPEGIIPPSVPAAIGRLLRSERHKRHISAEDLARRVGKPKALIESVEEGKRELDPDLADRILKVLRLPANLLLGVQQQIIRGLEGQVERLNEALAESMRAPALGGSVIRSPHGGAGSTGGSGSALGAVTAGDVGERRRGVPILGDIARGYPQRFDTSGRPSAEITGFVYLPDLAWEDAFALRVAGDSMESESLPSFREGDVVVFGGGTLRSRDFGFVRIEGDEERTTFRQVFFDPDGHVRLQPLNLNYPSRVFPKERILATWRLEAHVARF